MSQKNIGGIIAKALLLLVALTCILYQILSPHFNFQATSELTEPSYLIWMITCLSIYFLATYPFDNQIRTLYISGIIGIALTTIAIINSIVLQINSLAYSYLILLVCIIPLLLINRQSLTKHGRFTQPFFLANLEEMTAQDFVYSFVSGLTLIITVIASFLS